ncbi:hypothetical protein AS149_25655 [Burkholderia cenocepacia]|nr:hypothetical protein AS149_25655 [Burkholderia cenocepacia]
MYPFAQVFLAWTAGSGSVLFMVLMLLGGISGLSSGDPIPALEGVALAMAQYFLSSRSGIVSPTGQTVLAALLLCWTATFVGVLLRYLFGGLRHFNAWSPLQVWQRGANRNPV